MNNSISESASHYRAPDLQHHDPIVPAPEISTHPGMLSRSIIVTCFSILLLFIFSASAGEGISLMFYGEILASHHDYMPAAYGRPEGSAPDSRVIIDLPRFITEMQLDMAAGFYLDVEVEFEHGGTGGALEVENEEFGEYEMEIEKGGEVVLEQFYIGKRFIPEIGLKIGHFIVPVGLLNTRHLPVQYFSARRPESETSLIPTTWHETGVQVHGTFGFGLGYQLMLINGLDATGFSTLNWVRGGRQTKFEEVRTNNPAVALRLDQRMPFGLDIGFSGYFGNSAGNRPKPDMEGIDAHVLIGTCDIRYSGHGIRAQTNIMGGLLGNADIVSEKNSGLSSYLGVPRTPVGSAVLSTGIEAGYDIFTTFRKIPQQLYLYGRYEYYHTMFRTPGNMISNPVAEKGVVSGGINFHPIRHLVVKADYTHRAFGSESINPENTFNMAVGFTHVLRVTGK